MPFFPKARALGCSITSPPNFFTLFSALWKPFKIRDSSQLLLPLFLHRFTLSSLNSLLYAKLHRYIERHPFAEWKQSCSLGVGRVESLSVSGWGGTTQPFPSTSSISVTHKTFPPIQPDRHWDLVRLIYLVLFARNQTETCILLGFYFSVLLFSFLFNLLFLSRNKDKRSSLLSVLLICLFPRDPIPQVKH